MDMDNKNGTQWTTRMTWTTRMLFFRGTSDSSFRDIHSRLPHLTLECLRERRHSPLDGNFSFSRRLLEKVPIVPGEGGEAYGDPISSQFLPICLSWRWPPHRGPRVMGSHNPVPLLHHRGVVHAETCPFLSGTKRAP